MTDLEYVKRNVHDLRLYIELLEQQVDPAGRETYLDFTLKCIERIQQGVDNIGFETYVRAETEDGRESGG